jgi:hypothetical protein
MTFPRNKNLNMLGLGSSVGTGAGPISAEIIVVASFDELKQRAAANQTQGKIVVYNQYCDWIAKPVGCYGESVVYRCATHVFTRTLTDADRREQQRHRASAPSGR